MKRVNHSIVVLALASGLWLSLGSPSAQAGWATAQDAATAGWENFRYGGADAAFKEWQLTPALKNPEHPAHAAFEQLEEVEDLWGRRMRVEVILDREVSASVRVFYFAVIFDEGLIYTKVSVFQNLSRDWLVNQVRVYWDLDELMPGVLPPAERGFERNHGNRRGTGGK